MTDLATLAVAVLSAAEASEKTALAREAARLWRQSEGAMAVGFSAPPDRPARPARPDLLPPAAMPRRRGYTEKARAALLHAVQHIELNAIDLAFDMIARFTDADLPRAFYDDWVRVGEEEALHFTLLAGRMAELGYQYGDFPAHDGLWEAAVATQRDLTARLAVVPMVLEARGLDVTPAMIDRFARIGDEKSVIILNRILTDEITHVATGNRWFQYICARENIEPRATWQRLVQKNFKGLLKPPFNSAARDRAGLTEDYYVPLAAPLPALKPENG